MACTAAALDPPLRLERRSREERRRRSWSWAVRVAMSSGACSECQGLGVTVGVRSERTCNCVLRAIFRACLHKFEMCKLSDPARGSMQPERVFYNLRSNRAMTVPTRRREEYMADFVLVARRELTPEEYRLFRMHFLGGADWRYCTPRLGLDKGRFFHAVYRVQQKVGRACYETLPYGLFPVDEYFQGPASEEQDGVRRAA